MRPRSYCWSMAREWTGDISDEQLDDGQRMVRDAVMRLVKEGDCKAEAAQAVVHQLFEALQASPGDEKQDGVTVETFDEGKHYNVMLTFKGDTGALDPDEARTYADDLLAAADEAEAKMRANE